jgi:hypothetical protein
MGLKEISCGSVETINVVLIGPAGIGKTSQIASVLEDNGNKVCVVSAESGLLPVRDHVKSGRVIGWEISSFDDIREVYKKLTTGDQFLDQVKWVFIDSLTEVSSQCLEAMKAKYPTASDSYRMWGDYNDRMTVMIKAFRDIKYYNVVFTCLDAVEKDELNRRYVGPAIAGSQLKERLTSYFDEVLYMTTMKQEDGTEQRVFITQPYERYPAKDRSGKLDLIEKPDLAYCQ